MTRLSLLVDLAAMLSREVGLDALLDSAGERIAAALGAERSTVWLVDAEKGDLVTRIAMLPEVDGLRLAIGVGVAGHVARDATAIRVDDATTDPRFDRSADERTGFVTRSMLAVPIREAKDAPLRGVLQVLNRIDGAFNDDDERYLTALGVQLAHALALTTLRAENAWSPGLSLRGPFNRIVGQGPEMQRVYERVSLAAETDANVLLLGETGTGKTLFAKAIHVNSRRQAQPFVVVDCATLPSQLVESELFGHERGAFTGADRRVRGKVEMAQGGTLLLDEIGDLPLDSQGKLLRLLQDACFERVGGRETIRSDARIICATHRDLEEGVAAGRFRQDLYYRIRVVEIVVPALRRRGHGEVLRLARHFADVYSERHGRSRPTFAPALATLLRDHPFPGNVRELEHLIESAVVLARDGILRPPYQARDDGQTIARMGASLPREDAAHGTETVAVPLGLTMEQATDRYLRATLEACDGNRTETARRLGIGRNTVTRVLRRGDD